MPLRTALRERSRRSGDKRVCGDDGTAPQLQKHGEEKTDRPLTLHEDHVVRLRVALLHRLQAGVHGLDEGSDFERHSVRNFFDAAIDNPVHGAHILRETATGRLEARRHADLLVDGALGVQFPQAVESAAAGNVVEDDHAVAGLEAHDGRADLCDDAGGFVAVDARRRQEVVFDLLEVGGANTAGFNPNENLPVADFRGVNLVDRDNAVAAIDGGAHTVHGSASSASPEESEASECDSEQETLQDFLAAISVRCFSTGPVPPKRLHGLNMASAPSEGSRPR